MSLPARIVFGACMLSSLLAGFVSSAAGDVFGPISLASRSSTEQADYAHDPAISGNARFVAFDGSYGGVVGVWRRDLLSGEIVQVAAGDAELPSISADGRFVSFTTTAKLSGIDENRGPDVYVRDMDEPISAPGAFTLASAVTSEGVTHGLSYAYASEPGDPIHGFEEEHYGSLAVGRSAISADGRTVVFVTTATSDLTDPQSPGEPATPPLQVVARNLETDETRLVSVRKGSLDEPVASREGSEVYGAVFTGQSGKVPAFGEPPAYGRYVAGPPLGASISADGSTVAWMGANVGEQAAMLPGEVRSRFYTEPLWRRIAPGSETPTERVTGGSDPGDPACIASGEGALGNSPSPLDPCQGPFSTPEEAAPSGVWAGGGEGDFVPRLSADGYTVAFIARAQLAALGEGFGIGFDGPSDLYVVSMRPNLTRDAALSPLTRLGSGNTSDIATTAPILDFDLSPGGDQVAFTTRRTRFVLASPAYVTAPAPQAGMSELFDVDLADDTLTRVTRGYEGGASEHPHPPLEAGRDPYSAGDGALSPSFSGDGRQIAFASTASNLAFGDGNTPASESSNFDGGDAFVVERQIFAGNAAQQYVSSAPPGPALAPPWALGVTAQSLRDGSVRLYVRLPAGGELRAGAQSSVRVGAPVSRAKRRARHRAARSSRAVRRARRIATRTVASRASLAHEAGLMTLTLKLAKPYAALAAARGGLSAAVRLSFTAAGHAPLHGTVEVTFVRAKRHSRKTKSSAASSGHAASAGHAASEQAGRGR